MTSTNTTVLKIVTVASGLALVAMSFATLPVKAQTASTSASIQAQIQALLAQIAALQAQLGTGVTATAFTRDLTIGSRGTDVTALQTFLIGKGFSIPAGATGYFGTQTRAALAAFQAANGISPAAGYFGPITRGVLATMLSSTGTSGGSTGGSTTLQGGAGELRNISMLGDVETDLHEGDSATKVIGFSADANGSDLAVQRLDVNFTISGTSGSSDINRYIDSVSVYQDGKKLGTLDATAGDKNGRVWTFRFSDLNGIIRKGNTSNFYVEVTPVSSVAAAQSGVTITAAFPTDAIRAVDAEGTSETYTPSGTLTQDFSVSTATTGGLTLSEASDNPNNSVVKGDTNNTTDDVTLLAFNAKAKNQSITINNLPVGLTVSGTTNVGDVVQSVALMKGGTTLKTKTIPSNAGTSTQIVFDNINQTIGQDSTQEYTVVATIRKMGTGSSATAFDTGDTLVASTSANTNWDLEDSNGNSVTPSGSVVGGTVTFQTTGITIAKTNATYNKTVGQNVGEGDQTQYSIQFTVTAGDTDLYIDRSIQNTANPTAAGGGVAWATTTSSTAGVTNTGVANLSAGDTNNGDTATSFKVPAGTSRTFTLNVTLTATGTGFTGVELTGINWDTQPNTNTSTNYYTANLDTFRTTDVSMTTH